ncbi:DUF6779 domain-containing protein [Prauserella oleivorans]
MSLTLAVAATLALVLTDDLRWLRLGIVAALWAALIGGFVAARYRKQAATTEEAAAQAQEIYELELEREIAARREYELEIESETRERVEEQSREELEALRAEVTALRESLQSLFGGEVLWERLSLTAQSTRMRALADERRVVTAGDSNGSPARITAGKKVTAVAERPTELIARVRDDDEPVPANPPRQPQARRQPPATRPARAQESKTQYVPRPASPPEESSPPQPIDPPTRRVRAGEYVGATAAARAERSRGRQRPGQVATESRAEQGQETPVERSRPEQRPVHPGAGTQARQRKPEPARSGMDRVPRGRPAASVPPPSRQAPARAEQPTTYARSFDPDWKPDQSHLDGADAEPEPAVDPAPAPAQAEKANAEEPVAAMRDPEEPAAAAGTDEPAPNPTLPPAVRDLARRPGGRRRRPEPEEQAAETGETAPSAGGGGRRYRPEGEPWQGFPAATPAGGARRHSKPDADEAGGRRRAPEPAEDAEPSGSHSEGKSVSELLAAYGADGATPRRRRRAAD